MFSFAHHNQKLSHQKNLHLMYGSVIHTKWAGFFLTGNNQQHHKSQHDLHKNLAEVWPVGRQSSKHRLRAGILHRASPVQGSMSSTPTLYAQSLQRLMVAYFTSSQIEWSSYRYLWDDRVSPSSNRKTSCSLVIVWKLTHLHPPL